MVEEKLEGSLELRESMPFGAIAEMAKAFNCTPAWIAQVISGKSTGHVLIIECALKISDANYEIKDTIAKILEGYGNTYKAGK